MRVRLTMKPHLRLYRVGGHLLSRQAGTAVRELDLTEEELAIVKRDDACRVESLVETKPAPKKEKPKAKKPRASE